MDTNAQIISDLQNKIGFHQPLDFLSDWKGVPVMVTGYIQKVLNEKIFFRLEPPDSICFARDEYTLLLHDIFIMGIQGRILAFDLQKGIAELGEFMYLDRGFGERATVRVEPDTPIPAELVLPDTPIPAELVLEKATISCQVLDISLNGFGLLTASTGDLTRCERKIYTHQTKFAQSGNRNSWHPGRYLSKRRYSPSGNVIRSRCCQSRCHHPLYRPAAG